MPTTPQLVVDNNHQASMLYRPLQPAMPPKRGHTAMRHRMRCGHMNCRQRFTLKRHPDRYKRPIRCPRCKSLCVHSVERERRIEMQRQNTCRCHMYPFPHRAGSMPFCLEAPDTINPTQEDIARYQSVIETPRSACC